MRFLWPVPKTILQVRIPSIMLATVLLALAIPLTAFSSRSGDAHPLPAGHRSQPASVATRVCTPWLLDPSANPGTADNFLLAVSARTFTDAWAVGSQDQSNQSGSQTLIEHWNGLTWAGVSSPNPTGASNTLEGVTSLAANNAWTVGYAYPANGIYATLIEHWNGTTWQITPSPNVGTTTSNYLYDVAGSSASDVWAVGAANGTLVEHWNGTAWSIIPSPIATGTVLDTLTAVTALSSSDAWAVGYAYSGSGSGDKLTLILHWDGTSWSVVASPNTSAPQNALSGVSGSGADEVWAVGVYANPSTYNGGTLIEHWNGSSWTIIPSPNPAGSGGTLSSVSATSTIRAIAVGKYEDQNAEVLPLIEQWNGTAWYQVAATPIIPYTNYYFFTGVSALSSTTALAVGYSMVNPGTNYQTFAESASGIQIMTPATGASRMPPSQIACVA